MRSGNYVYHKSDPSQLLQVIGRPTTSGIVPVKFAFGTVGWYADKAELVPFTGQYRGQHYLNGVRVNSPEDQPKAQEKENPMLFKIKAEEIYGTKVGQDSLGRILLEVKGTGGTIRAVLPNEIEEVVPYTVTVSWLHSKAYSTHIAKVGQVKVGDLILSAGTIGLITAVDTKDRYATKVLTGRKVMTEELGE